jgi:hypothetical protein
LLAEQSKVPDVHGLRGVAKIVDLQVFALPSFGGLVRDMPKDVQEALAKQVPFPPRLGKP